MLKISLLLSLSLSQSQRLLAESSLCNLSTTPPLSLLTLHQKGFLELSLGPPSLTQSHLRGEHHDCLQWPHVVCARVPSTQSPSAQCSCLSCPGPGCHLHPSDTKVGAVLPRNPAQCRQEHPPREASREKPPKAAFWSK